MPAPIVILDRQHIGKPNANDEGAGFDQDGDGTIEDVEQEITLTGLYGLALELALREQGIRVVPMGDGAYQDRHARACTAWPTASLYVALHVNAGGGDYGAVFHDYRSSRGKIAASKVGDALEDFTALKRIIVDATSPDGLWPRPFPCIEGLWKHPKAPAILLEPFFIDRHSFFTSNVRNGILWHKDNSDGLAMLGRQLAKGIAAFVLA